VRQLFWTAKCRFAQSICRRPACPSPPTTLFLPASHCRAGSCPRPQQPSVGQHRSSRHDGKHNHRRGAPGTAPASSASGTVQTDEIQCYPSGRVMGACQLAVTARSGQVAGGAGCVGYAGGIAPAQHRAVAGHWFGGDVASVRAAAGRDSGSWICRQRVMSRCRPLSAGASGIFAPALV
jgi:hypothetical protein